MARGWPRRASPPALWRGRGKSACRRSLTRLRCQRQLALRVLWRADGIATGQPVPEPRYHPLQTVRSPTRLPGRRPCSVPPWPAQPTTLPMTVPHAPLWKQTSAVGVTRLHQRRGGEGLPPGRVSQQARPETPEWLAPPPGPSLPTGQGRTAGRASDYGAGTIRCWGSSRRGRQRRPSASGTLRKLHSA